MPPKPGGGAWWSSPPSAKRSHEGCAAADVQLPLAQAAARPKPSRRIASRRRAAERGADARDRLGSRLPRRRLRGHQMHPGRNAGSAPDRKSTRLNSSHRTTSYAVFCLKKKKSKNNKVIVKKKTQHTLHYHS